MRWFAIALLMLAGESAFGAQPRVNGVEVVPATNGHARDLTVSAVLRAQGLALSNINGTASSSLLTNVTLVTNVNTWAFSSASGSNLTLTLPASATVVDSFECDVVLGSEGTNFLTITPNGTDKIHRSTSFIITPGMALTLQRVGTNWLIKRGFPGVGIGGYQDYHPNLAGVCATPSSFFVMCRGQVLSDPGSPLNGVTLPGFTNDVFARYSATAGGTGGSATHTHTVTAGVEVQGASMTDVWAFDDQGNMTTSADNIPPYIDTVRLIRVK